MSEGPEINAKLPVHMIVVRENMYQKLVRMLKFILHYCEEQEHELQKTSVVCLNLTDNEQLTEGQIQIDVDGPWLKKLKVRSFVMAMLNNGRFDFAMHFGDKENKFYYLYNVSYNAQTMRNETDLTLEADPINTKEFYIRIIIKTQVQVVKSLVNKLRNFLKINSPLFPSVEIEFNVASYSNEQDLDDRHMKMICESVDDVLKYGTNFEFRKTVFEMFNVTSRQWASNEIYNHLCNCISEH